MAVKITIELVRNPIDLQSFPEVVCWGEGDEYPAVAAIEMNAGRILICADSKGFWLVDEDGDSETFCSYPMLSSECAVASLRTLTYRLGKILQGGETYWDVMDYIKTEFGLDFQNNSCLTMTE